MDIRRISWVGVIVAGLIFVFYDVDFVFDIGLPQSTRVPDPAVEEDYARCYRERDEKIHATAFGTIDNPDVQKEFISSNRERAARECRELHPEVMVTVPKPARFNLFDISPRFW